jgi:hypothetical protein
MLRKAAVLTSLLATTVVLTACGGSGPSDKSSKSASTLSSHQNAGLKLAHCMRTHGVPDFPDPSSGGGFQVNASASGSTASVTVDGHTLNVSGPAFQKAMQQCRSVMPQGRAISTAQVAKVRQGAMRMAACMRSHGVPDFPDPKVTVGPGGHGISVQIGGAPGSSGSARRLNPMSPAFKKAQQTCQRYMGAIGPGPRAQKVS